MKLHPVKKDEDCWIICDEVGRVVYETCPCCERTMLSERSAQAVIQVYRVTDKMDDKPF